MKIFVSIFILLLSLMDGNQKNYINDGPSMSPTINDGDRMVVSTDISSGINKDDIIIFKIEEKTYCKRVLGTSGDIIEIKPKAIYVNGILKYKTIDDGIDKKKTVLGKDEFYVIGDNIDNSYDSRFYGTIKKEQIIGKVIKIKPIQ